ncbi:unnamed protein product [Medioppia subpectinata]|uniref:BCL-6 corepressor n=1 Tax=Medioppia subpectinata TaxID=1979941 RepID=A0A7R9KIN8_9ACAR|nr:unnamed protein product [Medioppia subpectinata]CAG2104223.1 unnamed protein product [Medioppia subpectinata]
MYYPSVFAGVRPFQTLGDRVDNPLDLSVKQSLRPDAPQHHNLQLMIERKLAIDPLPSRSQHMPLLDTMYAYKPFITDPTQCPIGSAALMGQSIGNPYCSSLSSSSGISHLGLIPDLLHQNRDALALEASSLTPYPLEISAHMPYHMRIGSATAATIAINNANQRSYFGHNSLGSVLSPHMTPSFAPSIPHYSLYSDLLNDINRRPVEPEKSVFGSLAAMGAPPEPTTRFSEHLQRLRDHNLQQTKCSAVCCLPSSSTNACNCCNIGLSINNNMSSVLQTLSPLSSKEVHQTNSSCAQSVDPFGDNRRENKTLDTKYFSRESNSHFWDSSVSVHQKECQKEEKTFADKCHKSQEVVTHDVITIDEDYNDVEIEDIKQTTNELMERKSTETTSGQKESGSGVEGSGYGLSNSVKCSGSDESVETETQHKSCEVKCISTQDTAHQSHNHSHRETQKTYQDIGVKSNATKQLKDYKLINKNQNINSVDKRQAKETKTVEVQCDGPDWTPIVLPTQLRLKLQKAVRISLSDSNTTSNRSIGHRNESKKCKQKHIHTHHRNHNRSRSSSSSTGSSRRSSPDMRQHLDSNCVKSRKRSMLKCLVNSEGYVADKIKTIGGQHDLIVSDPSQLGREERALQRAIKHFEVLHKPEKSSIEISQTEEDKQSYDCDTNSKFENNVKEYQNIIESVVNESDLKVHSSESSKSSKKCKESEKNEDLDESMNSLNKTKVKPNSKKRLIESCETKTKGLDVKLKEKKVKPNEKSDEKTAQHNIQCKQKKAMVSVRRRRFRSGLDMIRNPNRRKKARLNQIQASLKREQLGGLAGDELVHKSISLPKQNSDSVNGCLEVKRLMVNKALGETLLHRAARSNRIDVVKSCLQSNTCDVNAKDNANYTPLHECSTRGNLEIAALLLQCGAHVDASATGGIRPLHDAIENNHIEVVRLLLAYGADPNISTYSGATPLQLSRSKHMTTFLTGFLNDISGDKHKSSQPLLWKFSESAHISYTKQIGFDVFDGLPSDAEEESQDFLFEDNDRPLDITYRLRNSAKESNHLMRLCDVLKRTGLTRDECTKRHVNVKIVSICRQELQRSTIGQLVREWETDSSITEDMIVLDDSVRSILGIETLRLG